MKAEIIKKECENKSVYPCLMQSFSGIVVLFTEKKVGIVIVGNDFYSTGEFKKNWIMDNFHKFEGRLIIEND